jgi:YD repeat-containing protein
LDGELKSIEKTDIDYDNGKGTFKESLNLFPTAGRVLAIRRTGSGDAVSLPLAGSASEVVDTSYTWAVGTSDAQAVGTSEAHLPFVYLQSTQTTFSEVPHQSGPSPVYFTSNSVEQIDEYGNVHARALQWGAPSNGATQIVATRGIGTTFELTPSRIENWQISLPQEVTTIDTRGGESRTHQSVSTYDEFGRLETSYDRERKLLTTIARTPSGAVESVSDADDQGNIRRISMTYDARELFPRVLRDAFENETQLLFDEATGQIATRADPNGVVEQWAYDRFGRIRRYVSPGQDIRTDYEEVGEDATGPIPVLARTRVETTVVNGPHSTRDLDPLGRLVRTITSGLNGLNISQEAQYNAQGQVQRRARPHLPGDGTQGIVDYAYDERNRLVSEMQPTARRRTTPMRLRYRSTRGMPASCAGRKR